ncbi:MAG: DUF3082 domain-containing protein [Trichodesmium sp. St16_bin4-tuft]|uniref:DUF3082 domain-containing protein n=1 Tax=Trichodesmium erythraeum (strain IMS101) TaxID=203124 RepID=Q112L0_TRIEI|nr:DUF3082 domain-containing protein [Trichodesmium erythraeum GBRTRLIN201]MCH2050755.1 DUF3082 domain-containing protein [Trichodesmium sp. ALOHA_ZT_67]MCL2926550.1 DUF3082 domain-containing protein [Trichodesmium sp. MAG_R01]MDE5069507.1 DUF3082 domain-containing protein [Trichodesmium sp. St4_bin8_1]MDE5074414.1 DUF3082 domain-containing protein [Trichodesmium sp. St5_bin8]MDE5079218.1 DUF3082 domain-containing protein [Trichodesmium sp. St2_bin6]MDE5090973.1 DUF3082 domain-containing prot
MTNSTPKSNKKSTPKVNPLQCLASAVISGSLATVTYSLMQSVAKTFASKPITSDNFLVVNLSGAVRTLVVGVIALVACICAIVTLGLIALAIQTIIHRFTNKEMPPNEG